MESVAPFGYWPSPLSAEQAAAGRVSLSEIASDGTSVYWLESRPLEGGRVVLVRAEGERVEDHSRPGVSIRSRVHEYGGGAWCLVPPLGPGGFAYVDATDQRVWLQRTTDEPPRALTAEPPAGERWAHGGLGASADGAWVVAVREVHDDSPRPNRCVVALGTRQENAGASVLAQGHDFYGAPRLDALTERLAVVVWDHPDMPWDQSAVVVIPLASEVDATTGTSGLSAAGEPWAVEGGPDISVGQPAWQRDGSLRFVTDRHGWWQPHRHSGNPDGGSPVALTTTRAEFHDADWALGQSTMAELADGGVVARMASDGRDSLVRLEPDGTPRGVTQGCVVISSVCAHGDGVAYIGAPPDGPATVWRLEGLERLDEPARAWGGDTGSPLGRGSTSVGQPFSFVGRSGREIHGLFYEPTLSGTTGPAGTLPPLIVKCHSGPTGSVGAGFDVVTQYFTSRGFAMAAVDYAGSTGYGRAYRCSLWGQWGVADSEDCVDAARELAALGRVDATRMVARGSSSGGLTALNALAAGEGLAAAVSWYGVTDLLGLARSTHDFEAHYTDRLIGPLPECEERYEARSPLHRAAQITGSVLLLQGLDDPVVPPAQTDDLCEALVAHGRHCEVRRFEGEAHGFRRAETLVAALEGELDFYRRELQLERSSR
jgi:dipeptidyl aminopeptidase/acylaminoacyl peptidase